MHKEFGQNISQVTGFVLFIAIYVASCCRVFYNFGQSPAVSVPPVKHRPHPEEQDDLQRRPPVDDRLPKQRSGA